jgi:hypothetical protein
MAPPPAYNGHFGCTCYHPLFVFNQLGDLERCALRPGNVHSAYGWREVLEPVVSRQPDRITHAFGFEEFVDLWVGESGVTAEIKALHSAR